MLASVGCPFGRRGSDPRQVQSCRPTGAFACLDPPDTVTNRWIRAELDADVRRLEVTAANPLVSISGLLEG